MGERLVAKVSRLRSQTRHAVVRITGPLPQLLDCGVWRGPTGTLMMARANIFSHSLCPQSPRKSLANGEIVDIVKNYKYLGTIIDDKLKFDPNTDDVQKRPATPILSEEIG